MSSGRQGAARDDRPEPLCGRIQEIIAAVRPALGAGGTAVALDAVAARLRDDRLRIAVGGRLNAGKSTLINALVGQRVAATGATECTTLVAWFRASWQNRIEVRLVDGGSRHVPGKPGGGIPDDLSELGTDRSRVSEIVVEVVNDRLAAEYTIVDTPGMDSLSGLDDIAMAALARADALLYVMPHPGTGDVAALEALRRQASASLSAANVLGVLSRVDELGDGTADPWPDARRLAASYSVRLSGLVGSTIPVAGLLAETALGDAFGEDDARLVRRLSEADPGAFERALYTAASFRKWDAGPLAATERERLLRLLGRYGLRAAVGSCRGGSTGIVPLRTALRDCSGIDDLLALIRTTFVAAADRLRAVSAMAALDAASSASRDLAAAERDALAALRAQLAEVRRHPLLRQAELGSALADLATRRLRLTESAADALVALATGNDAAACLGLPPDASNLQITRAADSQVLLWRQLEDAASRATSRSARTAREFCEALYFGAAAKS